MLLEASPTPPGPVGGGVCAFVKAKHKIEGIKRSKFRFMGDGFNGRKNKLFLTFNQGVGFFILIALSIWI
jgi:phosphoribosylaminoimidazole (AIR) synthetase